MGSAPMRAVRKLQASKNGCAAWQALHFKYRPHLSGNDEVDKDLLRIEHPVPEAQIEARLLMLSSNNLLKPADGSPVVVDKPHDIAMGCYYLTKIVHGKDEENLKH